jgi:hypothetical protein
MKPEQIIQSITEEFKGVVPKSSWGETSLFYNPGKVLPNGVYFCTIKQKNGDNDKSSKLDRLGIYRVSIGIGKPAYETRFGERPKRPAKGGIVATEHDFTALNELMPHPIYGWMSWVQILNPKLETYTDLKPLIQQAYDDAVIKFDKKVSKM